MTLVTTEEPLGRWVSLLGPSAQLAERIASTEFVPKAMRDKPDVVLAAILYGDEIGIGPMQALAGIHVVEGRPAPSAELMRALILRAGHSITVHELTGTRARVSGLRAGEPESSRRIVEWTLDMARAAGLLGRTPWQRYPRSMLLARATSDLAREKFPDVVKGLGYIAEESATDDDVWAAPEIAPEPEKPPRKRVGRRTKPKPVEADRPAAPTVPALEAAPSAADEDPWSEPDETPISTPTPTPARLDDDAETAKIREKFTLTEDDIPLLPDLETEPGAPEPDEAPVAPTPNKIGAGMLRGLHATLGRILGEKDNRNLRLELVSAVIGRRIETTNDLTRAEGMRATQTLIGVENGSLRWVRDQATGVITIVAEEPPG